MRRDAAVLFGGTSGITLSMTLLVSLSGSTGDIVPPLLTELREPGCLDGSDGPNVCIGGDGWPLAGIEYRFASPISTTAILSSEKLVDGAYRGC